MEEPNLEITIVSKKHNPLLKRTEVVFEVDHSGEGETSPRLEIRNKIANKLKAKSNLVFVEKVETKTGTMTSVGEANAYETPEQAKLVEREHIIARNAPPEKPAEEAEKPKTKEAEEKKPTEEEKLKEEKPKTEETKETKEEASKPKPEKDTREKEEKNKEEG